MVDGQPSDPNLRRYFQLLDTEPRDDEREPLPAFDLEPAQLSDPEVFLVQLASRDPLAWRNALEQEAERLAGRRLDDDTFKALLARARKRPEMVNVAWLESLEPHLSPEQLLALYRQSGLLSRLAAQEAS